jgi:hypothetical protein
MIPIRTITFTHQTKCIISSQTCLSPWRRGTQLDSVVKITIKMERTYNTSWKTIVIKSNTLLRIIKALTENSQETKSSLMKTLRSSGKDSITISGLIQTKLMNSLCLLWSLMTRLFNQFLNQTPLITTSPNPTQITHILRLTTLMRKSILLI